MYDVIIIGSGPAGISASLYTIRANLKVCIISKNESVLEKAEKIENYYGFPKGISGNVLNSRGTEQAKNLGVDIINDEVVNIKYEKNFIVETVNSRYEGKVVIIATGKSRKTPSIKGIKELEGKGISYCAICDAFFYKGKEVGVLGNGNYAIHEAKELLPVAKKVTIYTNGKKPIENRDEELNVDFVEDEIKEIKGTNKVESIEFFSGEKRNIDGIFIAEGIASSGDLAKKMGVMLKGKEIIVNENMMTNIPGIFACGDCTGGLLQISKAVYEGTKAGLSAISYIRNKKG